MSFDGVLHNSGGVAENERARAANKRAVPSVLSGLLNEALVYLREHAQSLAVRSFAGLSFTDASPHFLTRVYEAWLPPHATALVVVVKSGIDDSPGSAGPGYPLHYLRLVGGTGNIDTDLTQGPSSSNADLVAAASVHGNPVFFFPAPLTTVIYWPLNDSALSAVTASRTSLTMELWGHGLLDGAGTAADYVGFSASFYWLSEY